VTNGSGAKIMEGTNCKMCINNIYMSLVRDTKEENLSLSQKERSVETLLKLIQGFEHFQELL
jgi:hypothetical protein